jgi:hypothetical protein
VKRKDKSITVEFEGKLYVLKQGDTFHVHFTVNIDEGDVEPFVIKSKKTFPIKVISID